MSTLVFNRASDNYLFTIAEARGKEGEKLRLRSADSTSIIDISNDGNIELSGNVNVTGTLSLNNASISATSSATIDISDNSSTDGTKYITFVNSTSGSNSVEVDTGLYYNPSTGLLTTQSISVQDLSAGATDISSTLQVDGVATFSAPNKGVVIENDLSLNNDLYIGGIIKGPSDMYIDPASHGDNAGTLIIRGGLQVLGTTTTINSTIVDISDKTLVLASNANDSAAADGAGFEISGANVSFLYSSNPQQFVSSIDISAGNFIGALTGNASTASTLETSRTITLAGDLGGSVNFNGSDDVTLTATIQANSVALGTDTTGNYVATLETTDEGANYLTIANSGSESAAVTIDISASTSNDASTIVARDTNGNINANLTGDVTSSGTSSFVTMNASSNVIFSQNLDVSGLDVSNNATVGGTLGVTGAMTLTGSLTANGGISISGDLVTANSDSKLFVSKSTFEIVNDSSTLGTDTSNVSGSWITPSGYSKQINLKSSNSAVKMEFKVNFRASPEADQFISFQVTRGSTPDISVVFQDCSLGSNMGVTLTNVYNGTFIDTTPGGTSPTYTLHYKLDCPSTDTIDTAFGILGGANNRNYIYLQELYVP